ncbi:uncharacterized protein LOC113669918, partial [Pocillopora damicornis]|uniref:uncharacterized protein LOC113669918 n=1 Tax=Pocillopora damicornis TaxID=46731 RepID=UPI000F550F33
IDSAHNSAVRGFLCKELEKEDNDYEKSTIKCAVSRYYETKRQQYLDNLPDRRNKAEKTALQQTDANFMSGKENGEGSQEDVWVVRSPLWRSPQLLYLLS